MALSDEERRLIDENFGPGAAEALEQLQTGQELDQSPPVYVGKRVTAAKSPGAGKYGYFDINETVTTSDKAVTEFYGWDDKKLRGFQEKAFQAGLYGTRQRNRIAWGDHDEATLLIWKKMVDRASGFYAAGRRVTPDDALTEALNNQPEGDGDDGPTVRVDNPDDLRRLVREGAREIYGSGNLDPKQVEQIVGAFQAQQRTAGQEGVEMSAPPFETFLDDSLRKADPMKYDARKVVTGLREAARFLGGGGG